MPKRDLRILRRKQIERKVWNINMFLEIKNLTKSFDDTAVLKGINFTLEKGQVLSLIGSSGSGKTTLLRCINALETADGGTIAVDGNKIFLHIVNTNAHSSASIPLEIEGKNIVKATAWEIKSEPWKEISQLDTECFLPQESSINASTYAIPAAGVAAIELEFA